MTDYWFKNPIILLQNTNEFFPKKDYNKIQKVNAIARLAIYYSIIITYHLKYIYYYKLTLKHSFMLFSHHSLLLTEV
jgi:hypothetical protein